MPYSLPGPGIYLTAASQYTHKQPVLQAGHVGVAIKQTQDGYGGSFAAQTLIPSGAAFFLQTKGIVEVDTVSGAADGDTVYITSTNTLAKAPGVNEVQTVTVNATSGTYKLTFNGQQTGVIQWNDNAGTVQAALIALSNIAPGDVVVTGGPGATAPLVVTFGGVYLDVDVPQMTADSTLLVGGTHTATVATQAGGVAYTKFGRVVEDPADAPKRGVRTGKQRVDLGTKDSF